MPVMRKTLSIPLLLLLACQACSRDNPKVLPDKLNGFWTTDNPRYQDRYLELARVYVFIGVDRRQAPSIQVIDKIDAVQAGKETSYTIYSTDLQGVDYQMSLQFNPANGGEIQFTNQRGIVWKRHDHQDPSPKKKSP